MSLSTYRNNLIKKNILASFVLKGYAAIISLMLVPLTLNCLGTLKNGVWLTISSILLWIDQMDIGLRDKRSETNNQFHYSHVGEYCFPSASCLVGNNMECRHVPLPEYSP